jgi:hypothetical protein
MLIVATFGAASYAATPWRTYQNERWGYRIDVPRTLVSQPEPENGGGLAFISADGRVKLYTYGQYDIDSTPTISEAQREEESNWIGSSGRVTYRTKGTNWFVSSGIDRKGRIFYERYEQRSLDDTSCHIVFTISYPQNLRSTWSANTERTARSFQAPSSCLG